MKIDKVDFKILELLCYNSKENLNIIAKKSNISKQTLNYRIRKLIDNDVIHKFSVIVNDKYPETVSKFYLISTDCPLEFLQKLKKEKSIKFCGFIVGKYNIAVWTRNNFNFVNNIGVSYKKILKMDNLIEKYYNPFPFRNNFKHKPKLNEFEEYDKKDKQIINLLYNDSRMSIRDIMQETGFAKETVQKRILRFKNSNSFQFITLINKTKLETQMYGLVISTKNLKEIFDYLKSQFYCGTVNYDNKYLMCELYLKNVKNLYEIIQDLKNRFKAIKNIEPLIYVDKGKNQFEKIKTSPK